MATSARFHLRAEHGTVWLGHMELAALFQTSVPNINLHIKNVLAEGELELEATAFAYSRYPHFGEALLPEDPRPLRVVAPTNWKAGRVRKTDVIVAKNYLTIAEVDELNRVAAMFLDYAEDRASKRQDIRMADWRQYVDSFIAFNERSLLKGAGSTSRERMQQVVHERHAELDAKRRQAEALAADDEDLKELEAVEKKSRK